MICLSVTCDISHSFFSVSRYIASPLTSHIFISSHIILLTNCALCAGLLQDECKLLREKLAEREAAAKKLAKQQKQLLGSQDTASNEVG